MPRRWMLLIAGCATLMFAGFARAQTSYEALHTYPIGLRLGYTSWENTSQTHFGVHVRMGEMAENLSFTPNLEVGLGGNLTVVALNGDLTWSFSEMVSAPWGLYGGGSLGWIWVDTDALPADSNLGISALGGLTYVFDNGHEGMFEIRAGVLDSPSLKLTVGYSLF